LGLFAHVSDDYGYEWVKDIIKEQTGFIVKTYKKERPKKSVPKGLKIDVWNKCVDKKERQAMCICCNERTISLEDFHIGHIQPESKGGIMASDNLLPICSTCNLSMGSSNMRDYIEKYYPNNISQFDTRQCLKIKEKSEGLFGNLFT
jgi:5-methylcytosine-specific restriction endonuclease McrA